MSLRTFHPAVSNWFARAFPAPTPAQLRAWPAIRSGSHALVAAPTGSGKTLAAFLCALDDLVKRGVQMPLPDETAVVYVSPLKALSNDIRLNLQVPIEGIRAELQRMGLPDVDIRTFVRTGDTPQAEREQMKRRAPHIVVTTPESLYILLGSTSGRKMLATTRTVIVDEIHALAASKRGSHLAISLERLDALTGRRLTRIGLSATQKPIEEVARFLTGSTAEGLQTPPCEVVDIGHVRERDLQVVVPPSPLEAVMSNEVKEEVYDQIAALVREHRTTLIFVNTRRMAERAARHLSERIGKEAVAAHHGSLAREHRLDAEQRLKRGELRALVATASLELGIDIGDVDLVCQITSPRSIAAFLQRVGRSGHAVGATPRGRLFPQSRDDLVECAALLDCVRRGELDALKMPEKPLDVLAQQIVAEVACEPDEGWDEAALYELMRRAHPYRDLSREEYAEVLRMLAEGYTTRVGTRGAYVHRDAVNGRLRARRGARLTAITSGGTIPDTADYDVILEPQSMRIGSVNEDFAIESMAGDIFQLGNISYRILRVEKGRVRVEDANGAPPSIPFWLGEAAGRSDELSLAVSRLREEVALRLGDTPDAALAFLIDDVGLDEGAAGQLVDYLGLARTALGVMPTQHEVVLERFFDESGGTQLVIHSPYGSRINRAWGLALRKRFCRKFNFELQAAATEDAIVLSLSTSHSFPLEDVSRYLNAKTVREVLIQAMLAAPMFTARWRWTATTALALPRFRGGKKVAPQLQRMMAEDLIAAVFPDQIACAENLAGEREVPEHPLVDQTVHDCLYEAMDIEGLEQLLRDIDSHEVQVLARDTTEPSPLALEVINAAPYAFLDDAPLEERRTQAVTSRRWLDADKADDLGRLDGAAITRVREEAWPLARNADELHEVLMQLECLTDAEVAANGEWPPLMGQLVQASRATRFCTAGALLWVATERLLHWQALHAAGRCEPTVTVPPEFGEPCTREDALVAVVRGRIGALGPVTVATLAASIYAGPHDIEYALLQLESEGTVMRGRFSPDLAPGATEWCERRLLARIHRYTVKRLRAEIEPVEPRDFMRFLFDWQRVAPGTQGEGEDALAAILAQLEGYEAAAASWESELLPARVAGYEFTWLDDLCLAGRVVWTRLSTPAARRDRSESGEGREREHAGGPVRSTPIALLQRRNLLLWTALATQGSREGLPLSPRAALLHDWLKDQGASFFDEMLNGTRLLRSQLEEALGELVSLGLVNADSFTGLRALVLPASKRTLAKPRRGRRPLYGIDDAGRWSLVRRPQAPMEETSARRAPRVPQETLEHIAWTLLRRYGVVFWRMLEREAAWLPPWRELLRVYHRLEARGEIRGGRFVAGISGEQFALPDAIGLLRKIRRQPAEGAMVCVCGADPLNLLGSVIPGPRVPALTGTRILYRDGIPLATLIAGEVQFLDERLAPALQWELRKQLLRETGHAPSRPRPGQDQGLPEKQHAPPE
jgi:ATP-dependent Lhr-like helicase